MEAANAPKQQVNSCQKNTRFFSHLYASKEEFIKEYEKLCEETKAEFCLLIFSKLEKAVSENNIDSLRRLNSIINYAYVIRDQVALKDYYNNANNPIRNTNLVILACKQNKLEILKYLFSNDSKILSNLSLGTERNTILPDNEDEACHNAFYYAIRSSNIELLNTLINKWPDNYFTVHLEELDEILSKAYDELKLKNVLLSNEIENFVESQLINLRFFSNASENDTSSKNNLNKIKERIVLILQNINLLTTEYSNSQKKVDEKFLFIIKCITQNIHILKQQLKSTYSRLPWEEMEFCLISFFSSHIKRQEINLFYHGILNKRKILNYLEHFKKKLEDEKNNIKMDIDINAKLPKSKREDVVAEIINSYPQFEELYNDYEQIRDIYSLEKLNDCIKLALSVDPKEREGQLIITRVLQITGEYLKNTLESPKLSNTMSKFLLLPLPNDTRKIIIDLRDSFSHADSLSKRTKIEENMDINFFNSIQNDIKKVDDVVTNILYNNKLKMIRILFTRIVNSKGLDEMNEIVKVINSIELNKISEDWFEMAEYKKLEELIVKLNNIMDGKTCYEENIFDQINNKIHFEKTKSMNITFGYIRTLVQLKYPNVDLRNNKINNNIVRKLKYFYNRRLENIEPPIESHNLKDITELVMKIYDTVILREHKNLNEITQLILQIVCIVQYRVNDIKWIKSLREKLYAKSSYVYKQMGTCHVTEEKYNDQLALKLSELKTILNSNALNPQLIKNSCYERNKRLQVVIQMLVLDIMSILSSLKNYLEHNPHFLDDNTPLLIGKSLRNYLAHDNALIDILLPDPSISVILNARKLTTEDITKSKKKIGKLVKDNPSKLKDKYDKSLTIITNQERMFVSLKEGNLESLKDCLKTGADIYARDINLWTTLHFAAKGPSLEVIKFILNCNLSPNVMNSDAQSPLHIAAEYGRTDIVKFFIEKTDLHIDDVDNNGKTPLHIAAQNGHKNTVKILLTNNASANIQDTSACLPLYSAIKNNYIDITEILLEKEADVNVYGNIYDFTPLHIAAEYGHLKIVNFLLENGANVNAKSDMESTPLHVAASNGHLEMVNAMISKGANVNARNIYGYTPLHNAVKNGYEKIANVLLKCGANVNIFDKTHKNTPLHCAAKNGHVEIVNALFTEKTNTTVINREKLTPLHMAVINGHLEVVRILCERVDNIVDVKCAKGFTPLHYAVFHGYKEIVELLIRHKANVKEKADNNITPLYIAADTGYKDVADLLVRNEAKVNVQTGAGITPLHVAVTKGNKDVIDLLIEKNAEINVKNNFGITPLHLAAENGNKNIIDLLLEKGAKVDARSNEDFTPLHLAALNGHEDVVSYLIDKGAKVNSRTSDGFTPLKFAIMKDHKDVVNLLIKNKKAEIVAVTDLLHEAVKIGNVEIIETLIKMGANVNEKDTNSLTPLYYAIQANNKKIVRYLIEKGADVNFNNGIPLLLAIIAGYTDIVKILLEKKWKVDIKLKIDGLTPLHRAAKEGHKDIVELLLLNEADVRDKADAKSIGKTALHLAVEYHDDINIVRLLLDYKSDVDIEDGKNRTPLQLAVENNNLACVKELLSELNIKKADINAKSTGNNWTVLHVAAQKGNLEMVKYLTNKGSDVNAVCSSGAKPIHIAAREGSKDVVEFFLNKGCSIHDRDAVNNTLLHYAAMKSQLEVVKYLISKGADINAQNTNGLSIMHMAAHYNCKNVIEVLLENGAVYNSINKFDKKPLDMALNKKIIIQLKLTEKLFQAVKCNNFSEVKNYIRMGAFVNAKHTTWNGCDGTPLHYAAWKGYDKIISVLLQNEAIPNITSDKGFTPLHYAVKFSHLKVVIILLCNGAVYNAVSDNGKTPLDFAVDTSITSLFKSVSESFRNVKNGNSKVINDLVKIKDLDTIKAIMSARNRENETLIVAAIRNNFPEVKELKEISQGNISRQIYTALTYYNQGNYQRSLSIFEEALEKRKEILGPDNPGTLDIQVYIATVLCEQGAYQKALNMFEEILQKQKDILGPNDKDTLNTRNMIASIFSRQGRIEEALNIYQETVEKQKEILGSDHSVTLETQCRMALILIQLQRHEEALNISEAVFEKGKEILDPNNPTTLTIQALVLCNQNKHEEALKIFEKVLEILKTCVGINHPDTLRTFCKIAAILSEQKKFNEALKAYQKVLYIQKKVLGVSHPETLITQYELGNLLFNQGKIIGALKVFNRNFDERKAVLGSSHHSVLDIMAKKEAIDFELKLKGSSVSEIIKYLKRRNINYAAKSGDVQTVRSLLKSEADSNDNDMDRRIPLHFAIIGGHIDVVNVLLELGTDVTRVTNKGNTPLHTAVSKGNKEIVEILLQHVSHDESSDFINAGTTIAGTTALHVAAKNGSLDIVRALLEHGAIYNVENKNGETPFDLSKNRSINDLLGLVGKLFEDAKIGNVKIIDELRTVKSDEFSAVTNARNREGMTLLQMVIFSKKKNIAAMLSDIIKSRNRTV